MDESRDYTILSLNKSGDNVISILLDRGNGPEEVPGTSENVLLYQHGLHDFFSGDSGGVRLSSDPELSVKRAGNSEYILTIGDVSVRSNPGLSDDVLRALKESIDQGNAKPVIDICREILDSQVRRNVVNRLLEVYDDIPEQRVEITGDGWLVDEYYLLDWENQIFTVDSEGMDTYTRGGGGVVEADRSHEFTELRKSHSPEQQTMEIDGETVVVGEQELEFLSKALWLINRTTYHKDESFWRWNEQQREEYLAGGE